MTCQSPRLAASISALEMVSLATSSAAASVERPGTRSLAASLRQFWHRLAARPRAPRLALEELSEDRLRDLGLLDGRGAHQRDPWR